MQDTTFKTVVLVLIALAITVGIVLLLDNAQDSKLFNPNQRSPSAMPR
jgi:hypothetical protein